MAVENLDATEDATSAHDVQVVVHDDGAHVLLNGKRVAAKPGEVLRMRFDRHADRRRVEHAWVEDNGDEAERVAVSTLKDLEERVLPKLREFLTEAIRRNTQLDDGLCSHLKITVGGTGYDDDDVIQFSVRLEAVHEEEV